jgi:hypothetical protein
LGRLIEDTYHRDLHEKYGKIMKITGIPGVKNIVMIFDPDDIEKVRVNVYKWRILGLQLASCWRSVQIYFMIRAFFQMLLYLTQTDTQSFIGGHFFASRKIFLGAENILKIS